MKRLFPFLTAVLLTLGTLCSCTPADNEKASSLREDFLEKANAVTVDEDSVTFTDASGRESVTIQKNPERTVGLYASLTTLWYEAGGEVIGCIGADSSVELYLQHIGRDITKDNGMSVVSASAVSKSWDIEKIISLSPDLIICSTAMSGYDTISEPALVADIPVIAADYDDFADYLKWFKVFCHLNGKPELWESVALKALDEVTAVLAAIEVENAPTVLCIFSGTESLSANTSHTVLGEMIAAMGAVNVADPDYERFGYAAERIPIDLESVYAADPDIILVQCHAGVGAAMEHIERVYGDNPVWQSLRAVKEGRVYLLNKELFHNKPNGKFAEAYSTLAEILYGEN